MSNILFKRGSRSALNTLKSGNKGIEGAFYLTEDTHRLYAGMSGGKIVDLNQYITVVDAVANLNTVNAQKGDFAYIKAGNILAVYTNDDPQNPWVQINQNTDTTYTIQAAGDKATDPGTLSLSLYDQKDALASTANIKFIGTKGADVTVKEDGTVEVKGNPYTFVKDFGTPDGDGYVTKMDVTLTPEDAEEGVAATKFNITAGKNIEFKKNADGEGITIEGVDAAAFADADCTLNVNGGNATLTLALTNNEDVVIQAVNANADGKAPFHLNYGIDAKSTVNNQGDMQVYTMDEVDGLIANLNAMTYVGPLPTGGLPTSGVSIGDTYMSDRAYSFYLGTGNLVSATAKTGYEEFTAKVGDLFIATRKSNAENADGVIDAVNLQWTYIPSGDDSQADTTYYCSLNQNTNTFTICDKHDAAIGHIQVVGDSMITVKSVLDNANGIDKSDLYNVKEFNNIVNNDGTLKGYNREEIIYGDGVNSIDTIKDVRFVERKLVAVTIEATNINNTAGSLFCSTYSLVENQNNISNEAFALTSENDSNPQFYFVSVDANGTQTVTIYYLVDGDVDFNNLYLQVNNLYTQNKRNTYSLLELGL